MNVEIWSDVVCPWCYVGKRRFETAIEGLGESVTVQWRSFELDPRAPARITGDLTELLAKKYGMSVEKARQMGEHVTSVGAQDGIEFKFSDAKTGNTFDAHRLIQWAQSLGKGDVMKERLMKAYFTDGVVISDRDVLTELASEVGLDREGAISALEDPKWAAVVRKDQERARHLGISGVPFFVFEEKFAVSGAQPASVLREAILELIAQTLPQTGEGVVCSETSCETGT